MDYQKGYTVMAAPKTGLFIKRGRITDGKGRFHPTSTRMKIFASRSEAVQAKRLFAEEWGKEFNYIVLTIVYLVIERKA